jgi:hypothetical protein
VTISTDNLLDTNELRDGDGRTAAAVIADAD